MTNADTRWAASLAGRGPPDGETVSRDTPPTRRLRPSSTAQEEVPADVPEALAAEYRSVLSELDWLAAALSRDPPAAHDQETPPAVTPEPAHAESHPPPFEVAESAPEPAPTPPRLEPRSGRSPDLWGAPSPFLDERLAAARASSAAISREFVRMERRTRALRSTVERLQADLDDATTELAFLRSSEAFEREPDDEGEESDARTEPVTRRARRDDFLAPASGTHGPFSGEAPVFQAFTARRYDATVRQARDRHRYVAAWTVLLAILISTGLLTVTFFAHEPMPVWYLAALPLVWLIPVPFFLASFRGTHRLLGQERLELSEGA